MKRTVLIAAIAVALLLLAALALPFLVNANQFRPMLEARLSKALARDVKVGNLSLSVFSGGVRADDLSVADDPAYSRAPFLHTNSLTLGVELFPLIFSHRLHVTRLTLDQPQIALIQSAAGDWNFSSLGGTSAAPATPRPDASSDTALDVAVNLVKITNGLITFRELGSDTRSSTLGNLDVELRDFSPTSVFPFSISAKVGSSGDLHLDGTAGPLNATDAAQTPAKLNVKLEGFNLAEAETGGSGSLAGLLSLKGVAASNGKALFLNGHLQADKLQLARNGSPARQPVAFDFSLEHDLRKHSGVLHSGEIHIGNATASLTGSYAAKGDSTVLDIHLAGPQMSVEDLAAILPAFGVVLPAGSSFQGGTANAKLSFTGNLGSLVTSGSVGLNNTRLAGFDLGSKMSAVEKLAGMKTGPDTEIQSFAANVRMAPDGSAVQDIQFVAPAIGELTGAGTISPAEALDFKMRATLHTSGGAMAMLGLKGDTGVPFLVGGTASHPVFRPDIGAFATEKVQSLEKKGLGKPAGSILGGLLGKKQK